MTSAKLVLRQITTLLQKDSMKNYLESKSKLTALVTTQPVSDIVFFGFRLAWLLKPLHSNIRVTSEPANDIVHFGSKPTRL